MTAEISAAGEPALSRTFSARDYDLAATLNSGQAFRWRYDHDVWEGVIGCHWARLRPAPSAIVVEVAHPPGDWRWLTEYLQLDVDLDLVLRTFPDDLSMRAAVAACRGLRLLRQEPWECLASFILSSTKQILQIRQIIASLCECYGEPVLVPIGVAPVCGFPTAARLANVIESDLRACKMGFRAPYLRATARRIAAGEPDLESLRHFPLEAARAALMDLPGVGRKIADCVLLFAYGFQGAFPVDVWVMKALRQLYFPRRRISLKRLHEFAATHFGPNAGYAQQYLFHYMRVQRPSLAKLQP